MTTPRRVAATFVRVLAWVLLVVGLSLIALDPFPPSVRYALFWLGVMAIARGVARLAAWLDVAVDLSLLFVVLLPFGDRRARRCTERRAFALAQAPRRRPTS
jgi:membrane protein implicated in regulation of membrane protease activity